MPGRLSRRRFSRSSRCDRYAKEAGALVVKTLPMSINGLDGLSRGIVACVPIKHDHVLPRDGSNTKRGSP